MRQATRRVRNLYFYPRSPCGERHTSMPPTFIFSAFLSTLSLRRATLIHVTVDYRTNISIHALLAESDSAYSWGCWSRCNFYPRSPCGERPMDTASKNRYFRISIHALLAESDLFLIWVARTLTYFYPRSPCGERQASSPHQ